MRIQKFLSETGTVSRREAERLIAEGKVSVNGKVVKELWTQIDPEKDKVKLDNRPIKKEDSLYILLFKPTGYISTLKDERGRPAISDLIKDIPMRVFPAGRLDFNTDGLLFLTNDGDTAQMISHPRYGLEKTYLAKVSKIPNKAVLDGLREGIKLSEGKTLPAKVKMVSTLKNSCYLEIIIKEGKKRQIRRMLEAVGHPVRKLRRVKIGFLSLQGLEPGEYRFLTLPEIKRLKKKVGKKERE